MEINAPILLHKLPSFSEGSGLASKRDSRNNSQSWKKSKVISGQVESLLDSVKRISREQSKQRRRIVGGGTSPVSGFWMYDDHRELDPSLPYSKGKAAYVSSTNPLATVGLVDLDSSGQILQATAGIWLALQDVPAKSSSGYNVPQDPVPQAGTPFDTTVHPLKGDLDRASTPKAYWVLLKSTC